MEDRPLSATYEHIRKAARNDLGRVAHWVGSMSIEFSKPQLLFHLKQTRRRFTTVDRRLHSTISGELEEIISHIEEVEHEIVDRVWLAERLLAMRYRM